MRKSGALSRFAEEQPSSSQAEAAEPAKRQKLEEEEEEEASPLTLVLELEEPDGAEAHPPSAYDLALSVREREAIQRLVEDFA